MGKKKNKKEIRAIKAWQKNISAIPNSPQQHHNSYLQSIKIDKTLKLRLHNKEFGIYFGLRTKHSKKYYIGKSSQNDGNVLVVGTNGCGKSSIIAKSTLETWRDPFIVLDVKGELSKHYSELYKEKRVTRPYVIFNPTNSNSIHYDPFKQLNKDDPQTVLYIQEMVHAIIPLSPDTKEPYWINLARNFLSGAMLYQFLEGYSFIMALQYIQANSVSALCKEIMKSKHKSAQLFINEIEDLKPEQQAAIGTEVKQYTLPFSTDINILTVLTEKNNSEDATLSWKNIITNYDAPNVFLCLDQDKIEQWGSFLRLILIQLLRQMERRPDKQSIEGEDMRPILLLLDEFSLLGKIDILTNALTTLRSKKITFCLMLQSIAQLDAIYGPNTRKIIVDNCQYKVILNVTEPESQEYFSQLFGKIPVYKKNVSEHIKKNGKTHSYSKQIQEHIEPLIFPQQFTTNEDILLSTPQGNFSICKVPIKKTFIKKRKI